MTARGTRKDRTFEEAMERLEAIVSEIESDDLGLEKQFELFKEGMALARFCDCDADSSDHELLSRRALAGDCMPRSRPARTRQRRAARHPAWAFTAPMMAANIGAWPPLMRAPRCASAAAICPS